MRSLYGFTALAVLLAGAAGSLVWQRAALTSGADVRNVAFQMKEDFRLGRSPEFTLGLDELRQSRASSELSDPEMALPQTHKFPPVEMMSLARYARNCDSGSFRRIRSPELRKAASWHRFRCGQLEHLPDTFFDSKPFLHPSGASFAWLARSSGRPEFSSPEWSARNEKYLHLIEILRSRSWAGTPIRFSGWELRSLLAGETLVLTPAHVWVAQRAMNPYGLVEKYQAYPRADWEKFLISEDFNTSERVGSSACIYTESNYCWVQNPTKVNFHARTIYWLLLSGVVILSAVLAIGTIRRIRQRKRDSAQRLFTLQMLTHELRTPATSLRLSVETLREEFDLLPRGSQRAFLMMCEELQRLDRIVEASKNYLEIERHAGARTEKVLTFVNEFVSAILDSYGDRVHFEGLARDQSVRLERYWVELCIKNLVENAIIHGKAPVLVSLEGENGAFMISVRDQGSLGFASLEEMSKPFRKGQGSGGLGLGLAIVRRVVEAMNGEFGFHAAPTTFFIKLKDMT